MQRISVPWGEWIKAHDPGRQLQVLVVGSGYGGSVAALRLAEEGWEVTVLERGGEFLPGEFPNDSGNAPAFLRLPSTDGQSVLGNASGLFEFRAGPGAVSLVANGVGGGSLINCGVLMEPQLEVLAQSHWPEGIRHDPDGFKHLLKLAKAELHGESTDQLVPLKLRKSEAFDRLAASLSGAYVTQPVDVTIDIDVCTKCGDCASGCNEPGAKVTLRDSYLGKATQHENVTVVRDASVYAVRPDTQSEKTRWRVRVIPTDQIARFRSIKEAAQLCPGAGVEIEADLLVLAAGTHGSVEILQRSRSLYGRELPVSPAIGERYSGNGDAWVASANEKFPVNAIGIGADVWRAEGQGPVGPTITRVIDARDESKPLTKRIVIQEGSIPGVIANVFSMGLSTSFIASQLGEWRKEPRGAAGRLGSGLARGNGESLAEHTQLLLTMGHDESKGRLVWRDERDASVPYFADPGELETYKHQDEVLKRACRKLNSVWTPTPTWQLIPESLRTLLSGPPIPRAIMSVHPLGGCVMGDDPRKSVVDEVGRVWMVDGSPYPAARPYQTLYVLDGSIVPTSLGCNPLLTITALAERAMADVDAKKARLSLLKRNAGHAPAKLATPSIDPLALKRAQQPAIPVYLEERLVCAQLQLPEECERLWGPGAVADMELKLHTNDWSDMWLSSEPELSVEGSLRIAPGPTVATSAGLGEDPCLCYRVLSGSNAKLLIAESRLRRILCQLPRFTRVIATYGLQRRNDVEWSIRGLIRGTKYAKHVPTLLRYMWFATEARWMRYELSFEAEPGTIGPRRLFASGTKHIEYAATCGEILRYLRSRKKVPRTRLRETFFEQASNLRVELLTGPSVRRLRLRQWSTFQIDYAPMVERLPLRLTGAGDLPSALVALAEYPMVLIRYLLRTRIFDFRLPRYSGAPVVDSARPEELRLCTQYGFVDPEPPIRFDVKLGKSSSDVPGTDAGMIELCLWRYKPTSGGVTFEARKWYDHDVVKAKSILLVHAFGQSGYSFTLDTLPKNPAARLHEEGFDVWILDHRLSTRLPAHRQQTTVDQIAEYDIPEAVDHILGKLREERGSLTERIQIFAFAQCVGAAATSMALLSGRLSYAVESRIGDLPAKRMPKLAGLFVSQTHPHCVGQPLTQAKTWLPAMLRDAFRLEMVPFAVRDGFPGMLESWFDRLFAALPVPDEEQCPDSEDLVEDACATCRRIRFLEAPLFRHENVGSKTHDRIALWMGAANVRTFAQAAKWVEAERLVTEDGENSYVTDRNFHEFAALPVCFLHGDENELLHPEGACRSSMHYSRIQPEWSTWVDDVLPEGGRWKKPDSAVRFLKGYGHVDILVAEDAAVAVFGRIAEAATTWFGRSMPAYESHAASYVRAHLPLSGPFIGALSRSNGRVELALSFRVDDRFGDGKCEKQAGSRTWAYARLTDSRTVQYERLEIDTVRLPLARAPERQGTVMRMARRTVRLSFEPVDDLQIECLSIHEVIVADSSKPGIAVPVDPSQLDEPCEVGEVFSDLLERVRDRLIRLKLGTGPTRATVSRLRHYPETIESRVAKVSLGSIRVLAGEEMGRDSVTFGAGSCRYPGFRIEHRRVDRWIGLAEEELAPDTLDFALLLGDQIYADATGGFADTLNPLERFFQRHRYAFARSREGANEVWLGDWLAQLPVIMTPDDHEFHDAYPSGPPLVKASPTDMENAQHRWVEAAKAAVHGYQLAQLEPYRLAEGAWGFVAGPVRAIVLDTRSRRREVRNVLSDDQLKALQQWLGSADAGQRLNLIATGSVLLPGKIPYSDPVNPGRSDNFQTDPATRARVFELLDGAFKQHDNFRFLTLSGDYHLSTAALVKSNGQTIGGCIVAPPLYSPMPGIDSAPHCIWTNELQEATATGWAFAPPAVESEEQVEDFPRQPGNGLGIIDVRRRDGYQVTYRSRVWMPYQQSALAEKRRVAWRLTL